MKDRSVSDYVSAVAKIDWRSACVAIALVALVGFSPSSKAADAGNWIGAWTASPQPAWGADFPVPLSLPANLWNRRSARLRA
jgi:hypothetical protein